VVEIARRKGVWVQGEVGAIMGGHGLAGGKIGKIPIADPADVAEFVKQTGVDTIAAAIGTAHGVFRDEKINFKLLKEIKKITKKPFVLHGGSGINPRVMKKAVREGVNIVNIGTDIKTAFSKTLINNCLAHQSETDPRKLLLPTIGAVEKAVCEKMKIFGSAGRIKIKTVET